MVESPQVIYWLDQSDCIVNVNQAWDDFALANDGPNLIREHIVGRRLRDYLSGDPTRMFMDLVLYQARSKATAISHEYRCDAPGLKRFMEMNITPTDDGLLMLTHSCVREEAMTPLLIVQPNERAPTKRCSICNKINRGKRWEEAWDGFEALAKTVRLEVVYDVCSGCTL